MDLGGFGWTIGALGRAEQDIHPISFGDAIWMRDDHGVMQSGMTNESSGIVLPEVAVPLGIYEVLASTLVIFVTSKSSASRKPPMFRPSRWACMA